MKILIIGGTGTIGSELVNQLRNDHEVISTGRRGGDQQVDIEDKTAIEALFKKHTDVDGVISVAGDARLGNFSEMPETDLNLALNSKLRGNLNLIRVAANHVKKDGFVIITTGTASHSYIPGASSITMANCALEGYIKAIQLERKNNIRYNVMSPSPVKETLAAFSMDLPGSISAAQTAQAYQKLMHENVSGKIAQVADYVSNE